MKQYIRSVPEIGQAVYVQNREPLLPARMMKLPTGSIRARGWLGNQLKLMKDGMTGRLNEVSDFLKDDNGWLGTGNDGWEEQPYWFRGFYSLAVQTGDKKLLEEADRWIASVFNSVQQDGYYGPACNKRIVGKNGQILNDIWPHIVMNYAMISYYEYTKDSRAISLLKGFFNYCNNLPASEYLRIFDMDDFGSWHPMIQIQRAADMLPQIFLIYNLTGEEWLLEFAKKTYDLTAPPTNEWLDTHCVNFAERFGYPAVYHLLSGQKYHWEQSEYYYRQHHATWGQQPRGIFGADENVRSGKVDPRQGFETCAMVEYARTFYGLGRIGGDPKYAAQTEDIMLNHYPASHTPDLKGLHYLTASNQPQLDCSTLHDYGNTGVMIAYSPWRYRCCQHNAAMGWPYYSENLWQATADGGLCAWLYAACDVKGVVTGGHEVELSVHTDYPFDGKVEITIGRGAEFPLYLRIPPWCASVDIHVNDRRMTAEGCAGKYVVFDNAWQAGDTIKLEFAMKLSVNQWPRTGSVSVDYGPFTYSVKIKERWEKCGGTDEWPEMEVFPESAWNYGLVVDRDDPEASIRIEKNGMGAYQPFTPEGSPIRIFAKARKILNWRLGENQTVPELQNSPIKSDEPIEEIEMIPLGCARLRMACLPVIAEGYLANEWKWNADTFRAPPPKAEGE